MSAYLVNRDGKELGSFDVSQIQEGLKTGSLQATDWGWREGMASWKGLAEIVATSSAPQAKAIATPSSAPDRNPAGSKPGDLNPYAAPTANVVQTSATGAVPYAIIEELKGTKPWVRLISVLMWIGCVVFIIVEVGLLLTALSKEGGAYALGTAVGYGLATILIVYPTLKLSKYASNISRLADSQSFDDLAAALKEQRRFWKFYGILMVIYLSVLAIIFAATFIFSSRH